MSRRKELFWQKHLGSVDGPMIHFALPSILNLESIRESTDGMGFAVFFVDAKKISSESELMDAFAASMNFPAYFGRNWDALLDLTCDLSWVNARGYILIMFNGDSLPLLPGVTFSSLITSVEATVRDWRDERGEFGERLGPVPFHVIFSGSGTLRAPLIEELTESLCEHTEECSVNIVPAPVRLRATANYLEAEELVATGADIEKVLAFLRERGMDESESMYSIAGLFRKSIPEAKRLLETSQTWAEIRERDEKFREVARDALRKLGDPRS